MRTRDFILMGGGLYLCSALYVSVGAQVPATPPAPAAPAAGAAAARSANDGVYTLEQAMRGDVLYLEQCAACHGDNLEGSGPMPPLAGSDFLALWTGRTVADLFEKIHTTMPATAPGSLTPAQAADITAFTLSVGQYPAGTVELDSTIEPLQLITLDAPAADAPAGAVAARSANDGVYTLAQAMRGGVLYQEQCAACHGDNLEGSGPMPPLAGSDFLALWTGRTVADLFEKIHTTMPATAPGTLTPAQAADITAFTLSVGQYPAGAVELDSTIEPLLLITLDAPTADAPAGAAPPVGVPPATPPAGPAAR